MATLIIGGAEGTAMGFADDFGQFLEEYGVIGLALAVVIGTATTDLVDAVVEDLIMPIIGVVLPGADWRTATYTLYNVEFAIGHLTGEIIDFAIIALLLYLFVRHVLRRQEVTKI